MRSASATAPRPRVLLERWRDRRGHRRDQDRGGRGRRRGRDRRADVRAHLARARLRARAGSDPGRDRVDARERRLAGAGPGGDRHRLRRSARPRARHHREPVHASRLEGTRRGHAHSRAVRGAGLAGERRRCRRGRRGVRGRGARLLERRDADVRHRDRRGHPGRRRDPSRSGGRSSRDGTRPRPRGRAAVLLRPQRVPGERRVGHRDRLGWGLAPPATCSRRARGATWRRRA